MRKCIFLLGALILFCAVPNTSGALLIDFGRPDQAVQEGFQAFSAIHEDALDLYTPREFGAFDTTVTVSLSWNPVLPQWRSMQMIDRGGNDGSDTPDLLRDWTGTDGRSYGDPLTVTLSGLPAGDYSWLSYHHDPEDQTGVFDVLVVDALGERTYTGFDITDGRNGGIVNLADVTKFNTALTSDGSDISLTFSVIFAPDAPVAERFFVMNGFEVVPEPATIALLGLGAAALRRRRRS